VRRREGLKKGLLRTSPSPRPRRRERHTVVVARRGESWPEARGREGLLILSMETSVI